MAIIFLFYYEQKCIRKTKGKELIQGRKFSNMFSFIDDLATFNYAREFEKLYLKLCPPELERKRENRSDTDVFFLDIDLNLKTPFHFYF